MIQGCVFYQINKTTERTKLKFMLSIKNSTMNSNESGAIRVPVNIKTGSMGRQFGGLAYAPVASLHNKTRNLDIDMTWGEAIRKEFNLVLNPKHYVLRKYLPSDPQHSLNARISELLAEFPEEPRGSWNVTIIDVRQHRSPNKPTINTNEQELPQAVKRRSLNDSVLLQSKKRKVEQNQSRTSYSPQRAQGFRSPPAPSLRAPPTPSVRTPAPRTTELSNGTHNRQHYRHRQQQPPVENVQREVVDDDDDDETCSVHSQDSQEGDLTELGIPEEDFKTVFLQRIRKNLDGQTLLEAQAALRTQKATSSASYTKRDQWTKWSLTCPLPVSIIRTLFDV